MALTIITLTLIIAALIAFGVLGYHAPHCQVGHSGTILFAL
jgi:hypothetical protein